MIFEDIVINLASVDRQDLQFRISQGAPSEPLSDSIRRIGLMMPPLVAINGKRHRIISGFSRIAACAALDLARIPVRLLDTSASMLDCAVIAIDARRLRRPLTLMETARALKLLAAVCDDADHCRASADALGLPSRPRVMADWCRLADAPDALQEAVDANRLPLPMAWRLMTLPPETAVAVEGLFRVAGFGLNKQRECLDWLEDIARRDQRPLIDLITDARIQRLSSETGDRGQVSHRIRTALRKWRYPTIVELEQNQKQLMAALPLDETAVLMPPAHFEGTQYWLRLGFDSIETLAAHRQTLAALTTSAALRQLMTGADPETDGST